MNNARSSVRGLSALAAVGLLVGVGGCITNEPPPRRPPPPPPPPAAVQVQVFAYPLQNQTPDQQGKDRYECSLWATQQTGFDPSAANVPPAYRVQVQSGPPPGTNTALGVITGALIGAAVGNRHDIGATTAIGAIAGGAIGASTDAQNAANNRQTAYVTDQAALARMEKQAGDYRRALSACLTARGYSVR
jgi:outer membrane lipoprotein SlyB